MSKLRTDDADVVVLVVAIALDGADHVDGVLARVLDPAVSFAAAARALGEMRARIRFAVANKASPQDAGSATRTWHSERDLARKRYGALEEADCPRLLWSRIADRIGDAGPPGRVVLVALTALATQDLSIAGECGVDAAELVDVIATLDRWLPEDAIVRFDVTTSVRSLSSEEVWDRFPELVPVAMR